MKRLRLVFLAVTLLLLVPMALLIARAVASVQAEHEAHHATVAGRVFDEMERALSELLRQEETRPYREFRFDGSAETRELPPYVVGWFEVDPAGRLHSSLWPDHLIFGPRLNERAAELSAAVAKLDTGRPTANFSLQAIAPGSTVGMRNAKTSLSGLNRAYDRSGRVVQRQWVPSVIDDPSDAPAEAPVEGLDWSAVDAELLPMRGTLVDDTHLALVRQVRFDGKTAHQGVILSVPALGQWLIDRALAGASVASYAQVQVAAEPPKPSAPDGYAFTHRFGEPFASIGAALALSPLPDAVQPGYVYALAIGLGLIAPLGLLALYRMTAVVVGFAQRRNDFVSAVTHELKTPLTSIRMYGEMLREGMVVDEDRRQTYYTHITAESERLSRLIDNVLELARLEKGTRAMNPVVGDPIAALREVVAVFGPQAQQAGFAIEVEAPAALPAAQFDRDALVQVLFNLVDNAVKYARGADDRRIVLSAQAEAGGVVLTVRDFGPGVPERQLRRVFEPFYRGQRELTRTAQGTGIGLALVRGLVERMGGQVTGRNAEGGGFEVRVLLPAPA
ncbi:MAG: HAMP domain-containing histidine kinase [Myxococcales bacterium]|nr:HAMP domain-containing histidine kinase [Myxococcales bacterium]